MRQFKTWSWHATSRRKRNKCQFATVTVNWLLEYLFFEFDTKFFREVVNVMLTDLASMYLNAILNTKKLVDFKIIILFNCKWLQCDLIAISHSFYWKKFIYLISTYFSVFEIAFKYILARSVSITFTTYVKIILSNSKDVYSSICWLWHFHKIATDFYFMVLCQ